MWKKKDGEIIKHVEVETDYTNLDTGVPDPKDDGFFEFDEIDFSIIKNLPGNSTVGNFGQLRADGQLGADGQLHKIFEQVQNRFHWDKALGGRLFCHLGKTVTPYSLTMR